MSCQNFDNSSTLKYTGKTRIEYNYMATPLDTRILFYMTLFRYVTGMSTTLSLLKGNHVFINNSSLEYSYCTCIILWYYFVYDDCMIVWTIVIVYIFMVFFYVNISVCYSIGIRKTLYIIQQFSDSLWMLVLNCFLHWKELNWMKLCKPV